MSDVGSLGLRYRPSGVISARYAARLRGFVAMSKVPPLAWPLNHDSSSTRRCDRTNFAIARIVRVLGVLVNGRVPLLEALGLTRQTAGNMHFAELVSRAEAAVTRGSTISAALTDSDLVSASLVEAIRSGEQSGQVGNLLLNMAEFLDEENEVIVRSLTSIVEPVILIVLGLLVGFVAMSMFLPLFDLTSMTQRG